MKHAISLLVASQIIPLTAVSAQQPASPDVAAETGDKPVEMPVKPTSTPFKLLDNLVVVETTISGRPHSAVLDSGAGGLVMDKAFAQEAGLTEGQDVIDAAGAGTQAQELRPTIVPDLRVGPLRFERLPAYAGDLTQLSASAGFAVNFLIGAPAFKYGAVTVDYARRRVTFGPSGSAGRCAAPIPLTISNDAPVVEAEIRPTADARPVRLRLLVDLGTRHHALAIGGPFVRSEAGLVLAKSGVQQKVGHGVGGSVQGTVVQVEELRLGGMRIQGLKAALTGEIPAFEAAKIDGTLGVPLWESGVITFDYPAKTMCITTPHS